MRILPFYIAWLKALHRLICFTELEVFVDKTVRGHARAQTERGNSRGGATKKREISRTLFAFAFFHKST